MLADKEIILAGSNYSLKKIMYYVSYYFIAAVLLFSGVSKIIDPQPLLDTLSNIQFLSEEFVIGLATALTMFELAIAILLFGKIKVKLTLVLTIILFSSFLSFSIFGTIFGLNTDCGCFGNTIKSEIGWGMVLRNCLFTLIPILVLRTNLELYKKNDRYEKI